MVGLHGAGKTTSSAKLALHLSQKGCHKPALIACDVYRPAAIDQLETPSKQVDCHFFADRNEKDVVKIGRWAWRKRKRMQRISLSLIQLAACKLMRI